MRRATEHINSLPPPGKGAESLRNGHLGWPWGPAMVSVNSTFFTLAGQGSARQIHPPGHITMAIALYLGSALILTGLVFAMLPALPGIPLIFGGIWLVAAGDDYRHLGKWWLIAIAAIGCVGVAADLLAAALGAKRVKASKRAIWGAVIGTVVGLFFGIVGVLVGPFFGAVVGELASGSSVTRSADVGLGTWIGLIFGMLVKLIASFMMVAMLLTAWFAGSMI